MDSSKITSRGSSVRAAASATANGRRVGSGCTTSMGADDDDHGPASALLKGVRSKTCCSIGGSRHKIFGMRRLGGPPGGNLDIEAARLAGGYFGSAGISYAQQPGWARLQQVRPQRWRQNWRSIGAKDPRRRSPRGPLPRLNSPCRDLPIGDSMTTRSTAQRTADDSVVIVRRVSKDSSGKRLEASRVRCRGAALFQETSYHQAGAQRLLASGRQTAWTISQADMQVALQILCRATAHQRCKASRLHPLCRRCRSLLS